MSVSKSDLKATLNKGSIAKMDREKVISHLQIINTWATVDLRSPKKTIWSYRTLEDVKQWTDDAIAMLKEQEAVKPLAKEDDSYECICGAIVGWDELDASGIVQTRFNYCPFCGKAVKWE